MKRLLVKDLFTLLNTVNHVTTQRDPEYLEWVNSDLVGIVEEFAQKNNLIESYFIKSMNNIFRSNRFELLLKRWLVEYFLKLFQMLNCSKEIILEDNPLNRFGTEQYYSRFNFLPKIEWRKQANLLQKALTIFLRGAFVFYFSLNNGLKIFIKRKKYKVMREALWGLYDFGGYYFHDDFFVDGDKIKKEDLLLFSRGIPTESGRLKGYNDARKSPYSHFNLNSLSLDIEHLFLRIIPKYIILADRALFREMHSVYFSLYWSVYLYFIYNALPYEKVFSNFEIVSELGHSYYSTGHIPEAIICQNHGAKYYLMHWSDNSIGMDKYLLSFLGCDGFFLWGMAHQHRVEGDFKILLHVGFVFKRAIKGVMANKDKIESVTGIKRKGKIISFFDESFGKECKMTENHFITFWETALKFAAKEVNNTIVIKPKYSGNSDNISKDCLKKRFLEIKNKLEQMENVYIINPEKWSFIEVIGVSDIVVTQGMTSSSTIAIICGIQGLYLDQAGYSHLFSRSFKDKIVFNDPEKLLAKIGDILNEKDNPLSAIPENILRSFDAYNDDRGIDIFCDILSGNLKKKVGIIVQARMGSTRLPGKVMRTMKDKSMLDILIERLRMSKKAQLLTIATSVNKSDDIIEEFSESRGIFCFRGSEEDVLKRYYMAAKEYGLDIIVRITSDCPLMDSALVDDIIDYYLNNHYYDYVSNTLNRTYPRGFDIEVFSFKALETAEKNASKQYEREHVTPFIYENMRVMSYENNKNYSEYRVTVDTADDMELVSSIYGILGGNEAFGWKDVVNLLKSRPDLVLINKHVEQKQVVL